MSCSISCQKFGTELVELWGFKHCRDIKIHVPANGIVTVAAEFIATKEQTEQLSGLLKKYRLEEIK